MAVQLSVLGLYLPPVSKSAKPAVPPQMIISLPLHTAVWEYRASGAFVVLVGIQLSVLGLYFPPVFNAPLSPDPPQTSITSSLPDHTAVWPDRAEGALLVLVAVQLSVLGLYLPPVSKALTPSKPPQTIISL